MSLFKGDAITELPDVLFFFMISRKLVTLKRMPSLVSWDIKYIERSYFRQLVRPTARAPLYVDGSTKAPALITAHVT